MMLKVRKIFTRVRQLKSNVRSTRKNTRPNIVDLIASTPSTMLARRVSGFTEDRALRTEHACDTRCRRTLML